jgi:hypothetical protein
MIYQIYKKEIVYFENKRENKFKMFLVKSAIPRK